MMGKFPIEGNYLTLSMALQYLILYQHLNSKVFLIYIYLL